MSSQYLLRRLVIAIPTLVGISLILFFLMHLAPGGPEAMLLGDNYSPEQAAQIRRNLGLDQPVPIQYVKWLANVARGQFGRSFVSGEPVLDLIVERIGATLSLTVTAFVLAVLLGVSLGVVSAVRRGSWLDRIAAVVAFFGVSFPSFWLGIMLILFFSVTLGWLPSSGISTYGKEGDILARLRHLILPAVTLSTLQLAIYMRFTRSGMVEVLGQDYIRTARAKGLRERFVLVRHALRNALMPLLTVLGFSIKSMISGAVLVETVFAWPGLGRLTVNAVFARDYPLIMAVTLLIAVVTVLSNLLVDMLYASVNPRIRYE